ncbi:MAG: alpha/beta fold hydrolase [Bacteroidales bacterium]
MCSLHYRIKGAGPAIVLLHGFMESMEMWNPFLPSLTQDFTVVMPDLPGHGRSECYNEEHSMEFMAEEVKKVLEKENIKKCTLIGHSMGGYVAMAFGRNYPEFLNGIVLFHSHPDADTPEGRKNRERIVQLVKKDKTGFIRNFIPSLYYNPFRKDLKDKIEDQKKIAGAMKPEGIIAALKGMKSRKSTTDVIQNTQLPILFIIGKQDSRTDLNRMLQLVGMPAHSESLILEHAGHMGFFEAEYETLSTLHYFSLKCAGR